MRAFNSTKGLSYSGRCDPQKTMPIPQNTDPNKKTATCLYIIGPRSTGPVKIGISCEPKKRARALESYESFSVFDGFWFASKEDAHEAEQTVHRKLQSSGRRINKEWFKLTASEATSVLEEIAGQFRETFVGRGTENRVGIWRLGLDGRKELL